MTVPERATALVPSDAPVQWLAAVHLPALGVDQTSQGIVAI